jgi:chorismate mutase
MSSRNQPLDRLRQEIDEIDGALHQLILKRGAVVEKVRAIKKDAGPALRPGREAAIMRNLAARHDGGFPLPALVYLWREMISGTTHMQQPLSAAVYAPPGSDGVVRLTRDHYGGMASVMVQASASACLRTLMEGSAHIAVLPMPFDGEANPWWPMLMSQDDRAPQIVSRLPFLAREGGDEALVVAPWARDSSDFERSLLAIRLGARTSRGRILGVVAAAGFADATPMASSEIDPEDGVHLIGLDGYVAKDDPRLDAIAAEFGQAFLQANIIGGYAEPLALSRS